jgi:hypothetical protein
MADEIIIPDPPVETGPIGKSIGSETIRVKRKPHTDSLDDTSGPEEEFDIEGCVVIPRAAQEAGRGWVQRDGYTVAAPHGSDVTADDDVVVRGYTYSVEGVPGDFRNKRGKGKVLLITLSGVR